MSAIPPTQLSFKKRTLWMLIPVAIQWIYVPASLRTSGGIMPKLPFDSFPIEPLWVIPYLLCFPLWLGGMLWLLARTEDRFFRAFFTACLFTTTIGVTTFVVFPTYVIHPVLSGVDIWTRALKYVYVVGGSYAALPSAHIYMTTLLVLFFSYLNPHQRMVWGLVYWVVVFSTLFTGQHYILDVVAGTVLGWLGYCFGLWYARSAQPASRLFHKLMHHSR